MKSLDQVRALFGSRPDVDIVSDRRRGERRVSVHGPQAVAPSRGITAAGYAEGKKASWRDGFQAVWRIVVARVCS
jgi:hypothetical protein